MNVQIELSETELRYLVLNHINAKLGGNAGIGLVSIHSLKFEIKTTYRDTETWRKPTVVRVTVEKEVAA